jgi:hypothetical protein
MPTYDFLNQQTGDIFEMSFTSWRAKDDYLAENPHLVQTYTKPPAFTGDHVSAVKKYDTGFKEVLQRIHEKTPGSQLDKSSSQL